MSDKQLPRIVTAGLFLLTALSLVAATVLKIRGVDATDLTTIGATGVGALAGFIARGNNGHTAAPEAPEAV
jgi:hypothetical protein